MLNRVLRFFDIYAPYRGDYAKAHGLDDEIAWWRQLSVWLGCGVGFLIGPYLIDATTGHPPTFSTIFGSPIELFFAALIAAIITAGLFWMGILKPTTAFVIQVGVAIVAGASSGKIVPIILDQVAKLWATNAGTG